MKDLLTRYNINLIRTTLALLYPKYRFVVGARYDPINFAFIFIIKVLEGSEEVDEGMKFTIYVDDLYTDTQKTLTAVINEASDLMKETGF